MAIRIDTTFKLKGYIESLIGGRSENQDSAGALETNLGTVIVVCDGMGGLNGGSTASRLAVQTIIDDVAAAPSGSRPIKVLEKAIDHANSVIIEKGEEDSSVAGMGTTVTAVIINKQCVSGAYVGDSRIYQLRSGKKVFRTTDHSQIFEYVKMGAISEEQARLSPNSNIILKALGVSKTVEPDVFELPYIAGDRFVLCSDGFWGAQPEADFLKAITDKGELSNVIKAVATDIDMIGIQNGNHHDNLTAAVFDVECDSILKENMRKSVKITIASLAALLLLSLSCNFIMIKKLNSIPVEDKAEKELSEDIARSNNGEQNNDKGVATDSDSLDIKEYANPEK